ncbi:helix-turn-helix domain-containing protein [Micromonospora purpureochromogenes]|uniref:helix-turn-helix domain-containing protein n=1 Tax=Micromonospora purpureochromogenes TaxID=47872 RepID=UPI00331AF21E
MAQTRINVPALYAALDAARKSKNLSWRQLAAEVGCSPSTMTRLANGYRPDADAFMTLTQWLKPRFRRSGSYDLARPKGLEPLTF